MCLVDHLYAIIRLQCLLPKFLSSTCNIVCLILFVSSCCCHVAILVDTFSMRSRYLLMQRVVCNNPKLKKNKYNKICPIFIKLKKWGLGIHYKREVVRFTKLQQLFPFILLEWYVTSQRIYFLIAPSRLLEWSTSKLTHLNPSQSCSCYVILCPVVLYYVMLCHVMSGCAMLYHVVSCHTMISYAM